MGKIPGLGTEVSTVPRNILATQNGAFFLPGGGILSGANSRDPGNTGDLDTLRAGVVLGKREVDNKYAPSIIGLLTTAYSAGGASVVVSAAAGDEVARRIVVGGMFRIVGSPAAEVFEVQTVTLGNVLTAGTFKIGYKGEYTSDIAFGASVATIDTAIALLLSVIADGGVTLAAGDDPASATVGVWTWTEAGPRELLTYDIDNATIATRTQSWARTTLGETANGVKVSRALSFSAETAGTITLAANTAVAEVQLITIPAVLTAGTYTYTYKGETTAPINWNASDADQIIALELLSTVGPGDIVPQAANEPDASATQTFTFLSILGDVGLITMDTSLATPDDPAVTTTTTPGEYVAFATALGSFGIGSMLMPLDGSETPRTFVFPDTGIKLSDKNNNIVDLEMHKVITAGMVNSKIIVDYPTDGPTQNWLKGQFPAGINFNDSY